MTVMPLLIVTFPKSPWLKKETPLGLISLFHEACFSVASNHKKNEREQNGEYLWEEKRVVSSDESGCGESFFLFLGLLCFAEMMGVVKIRRKRRRDYATSFFFPLVQLLDIWPDFSGKLEFHKWNRVFLGKLEFHKWNRVFLANSALNKCCT